MKFYKIICKNGESLYGRRVRWSYPKDSKPGR